MNRTSTPFASLFVVLLLAVLGGIALLVGALFSEPPAPATAITAAPDRSPDQSPPDRDREELARLRTALAGLQRSMADRDQQHRQQMEALEARIAELLARPVGDDFGRPNPGPDHPAVTREELLAAAERAAREEVAHWKRVEVVKAIRATFDAAINQAAEAGFLEMTDALRSALDHSFNRVASPVIEGDFGNNPTDWDFSSLGSQLPRIAGNPDLAGRLRYSNQQFTFDGSATIVDRGVFPWRGSVSDRLTPAERHRYRVQITEAGIARFVANWSPAAIDVDMQLLRAGSEVATGNGEVDGVERMEGIVTPGDYELLILIYRDEEAAGLMDGESVDYRINWSVVAPTAVAPGQVIDGTVDAGSVRTIRIDLPRGHWTVDLRGEPADHDLDLEVLDADGDSIAESTGDTGVETITPFVRGGTVYVLVKNLTEESVGFRLSITEGTEPSAEEDDIIK